MLEMPVNRVTRKRHTLCPNHVHTLDYLKTLKPAPTFLHQQMRAMLLIHHLWLLWITSGVAVYERHTQTALVLSQDGKAVFQNPSVIQPQHPQQKRS